ncbi:MAG: hypothetical protein DA408_10595 [Bacteroidetes bacterium]|nr:MAG: hypothetical protein DA408_10595 [Bacteroidota bacterium]
MLYFTIGFLTATLLAGGYWYTTRKPEVKTARTSTPQQVGDFYNTYHDQFLQVYGQVIQAFRTTDLRILLDYQVQAIGLADGFRVLDAGCGVAGPAIHFAQQKQLTVDALTISSAQQQQAQANIAAAGLTDRITVTLGDYHQLTYYYPKDTFDAVYFLESFGHAHDQQQVIRSAWEVLQPGGILYLKDLFRKVPVKPEHEPKIAHEIARINTAYRYNVADLYDTLHYLRQQGFIVALVKTIDLPLEDFENLTISNDFQELTGLAVIENWQEYIFPVDFFEIKCIKPWYELSVGNSRYFLQNLYHLKMWHKDQADL